MKSFFNLLLLILVPLIWNFAFIQWSIGTRNEVSLDEAKIPESTLAFLDSLSNRILGGSDDHLIMVPVDSLSTESWDNAYDYGQRVENGLYVYEPDSLFVIYCDVQDDDLVKDLHHYVLSAIEPMKKLMGRYVYPYMVNGRKLSLYLCYKEDVYQNISRQLSECDSDYSKTWGLCIHRYWGCDVQTLGITLNYGHIKRYSDPKLNLKATIWHEMNHYVYFQSIDLSKEISLHTWMYEGLAEYFSSQVKRQTTGLSREERSAVYRNSLSSSFNPFLFNYSGGELFYDYLESNYGKDTVCRFVENIYRMPLETSLVGIGTDISHAQGGWVRYIENNYI